jgi:hypothetical protein
VLVTQENIPEISSLLVHLINHTIYIHVIIGAKNVMTFEQDRYSKCVQAINAHRREHVAYPVVFKCPLSQTKSFHVLLIFVLLVDMPPR